VRETEKDLSELQHVLDASHASAGAHMRNIFTDQMRLSAEELGKLLTGVRVLNLATVTAKGEPLVGPVDGLFFRGKFYFGSSPISVRFRHIRARPAVSAAHVEGEQLAVIVHGIAHEIDVTAESSSEFRDYLVEVYGGNWSDWGSGAPYAWIEPRKMFTRDSSKYRKKTSS
jgi:uncharacterized pyridoxamine 5'-phosphate oxidase family protein